MVKVNSSCDSSNNYFVSIVGVEPTRLATTASWTVLATNYNIWTFRDNSDSNLSSSVPTTACLPALHYFIQQLLSDRLLTVTVDYETPSLRLSATPVSF